MSIRLIGMEMPILYGRTLTLRRRRCMALPCPSLTRVPRARISSSEVTISILITRSWSSSIYPTVGTSVCHSINIPTRKAVTLGKLLTHSGPFHQSLDHRTRIAASFPAQTGNHKFPRANGQVSVFWVNNDHTVSRRILNNHHWSGIQHLSSRIKVSPGGGLLAWSWVPPNAQRPVHERLNWVGSDGHLHQYST